MLVVAVYDECVALATRRFPEPLLEARVVVRLEAIEYWVSEI